MAKFWQTAMLGDAPDGLDGGAAGSTVDATPDAHVDVMAGAEEMGSELDGVSDGASNDIETLEQHEEVLAEGEENGGVDTNTAAVVQASVERIRKNYGPLMNGVKMPVPSRESFGLKAKRGQATTYAREAVGETISRVWETIKEFFKQLKEKIAAWFKSVFDSNTKLAKKVADLRKAVTALEGSSSQSTIEDAGLAAKLRLDGKVDEKTVTSGLQRIDAALTDQVKVIETASTELDAAAKVKEPSEKDAKRFATAIDAANSVLLKARNKVGTADGFDADDGPLATFVGSEMMGGKGFVVRSIGAVGVAGGNVGTDDSSMAAYGKMSAKIGDVKPKDKFEEKELPVADDKNMQEYLGILANFSTAISKVRDKSGKLESVFDNVSRAINDMSKTKSDTKEQSKTRDALTKAMKGMGALVAGSTVSLTAFALDSGWATVKYVEKSMATYKK